MRKETDEPGKHSKAISPRILPENAGHSQRPQDLKPLIPVAGHPTYPRDWHYRYFPHCIPTNEIFILNKQPFL